MGEAMAKKRGRKSTTTPSKDVPLPPTAVGVLSKSQVCAGLGGISVRKLSMMVSAGEFPRPDFRIGGLPRWSVTLFNAWIEENRIRPGE